jgi:hypothetical protein
MLLAARQSPLVAGPLAVEGCGRETGGCEYEAANEALHGLEAFPLSVSSAGLEWLLA